MSVDKMDATEESCGGPHVGDPGVTTVEWLMFHWCFPVKFLCFFSDFTHELGLLRYTLVLDTLGDSVFTVHSCYQVMLQKLFLQIFMHVIVCSLYVFIFACSLFTFALYLKKCIVTSVISL